MLKKLALRIPQIKRLWDERTNLLEETAVLAGKLAIAEGELEALKRANSDSIETIERAHSKEISALLPNDVEAPADLPDAIERLKPLGLDGLFSLMERGSALGDEQKRVQLLCDYIIKDAAITEAPSDPFSSEYRAWVLKCHELISGRTGYEPVRDEKIDIIPSDRAKRPGIYKDGGL